jgi:hypothetical protein
MKVSDERTIIRLSRRIKKLEADIALANARIAALEARPISILGPYIVPQPASEPVRPWPGPYPNPYIGDSPLSPPITCSGGITYKDADYKVIQ